MHAPLYAVIFSKDRACQLDSLLRSMRDNFRCIPVVSHILYRASSAQFAEGYRSAMRRHDGTHINWREQRDFRQDFIDILEAIPPAVLVLLLVDDDVVFRPFDDATVFDHFTVHHLFIDLCFYIEDGRNARLPFVRRQPYYEWKWAYYIKWRRPRIYPFSLDGHIYARDILLRLARQTLYKAPNSLESAMHAEKRRMFVWKRHLALAPTKPVIFNNPINSVQMEGETAHLNITASELNSRFCTGYEIDNEALYHACPDAAHYAVPVMLMRSLQI